MIVVFGSINLDLTAAVDRLPRPGETIAGRTFAAVPGGKGANQALAARRAGAQVALAGAVGTDALAESTLIGLVDGGVDIGWVRRVATPTGVALIHVEASGQNSITVVPGANGYAQPLAIPDAAIGSATTVVMQLEVPMAAVVELALRARRLGARVMLNAAPAGDLPQALCAALDVLVVNEHEAAALAASRGMPTSPEGFASAIHDRYRCATVVTLGARGALAALGSLILSAAAPAVDVVDTTGAGDAFVGALAASLDRGAEWPRALAEGVAAGSLACRGAGAQSALPSAGEIALLAGTVESHIVATPIT